MFFLIITVFIAEVIIAYSLIKMIMQADARVLALDEGVSKFRLEMKFYIRDFRAAVVDVFDSLRDAIRFLAQKRQDYIYRMLKNAAFVVLAVTLKDKWRKSLVALHLVEAASDFWDKYVSA